MSWRRFIDQVRARADFLDASADRSSDAALPLLFAAVELHKIADAIEVEVGLTSSGRPPEEPPLTDPSSPAGATAGGDQPQPETSNA